MCLSLYALGFFSWLYCEITQSCLECCINWSMFFLHTCCTLNSWPNWTSTVITLKWYQALLALGLQLFTTLGLLLKFFPIFSHFDMSLKANQKTETQSSPNRMEAPVKCSIFGSLKGKRTNKMQQGENSSLIKIFSTWKKPQKYFKFYILEAGVRNKKFNAIEKPICFVF